jgi:hypothetical protein
MDGGEMAASCPVRLTSRESAPLAIEEEVVWATQPVWTLQRREKSPAFAENRTQIPQPFSP